MRLAVWYHTRMEGGNPAIALEDACALMGQQMTALKRSGLEDAASEILIASNGPASNALYAAMLAPRKARIVDNGPRAESHLPTVNRIREWLPGHQDWAVCYFHMKGITHAQDALCNAWRRCMENVVLWHWQQCVLDMEAGFDSVGAHWLTPERWPGMVKTPFWGGMFFWAKASFLMTLPPVPEKPTCREDWFKSEGWIGDGPKRPKIMDYAPHWPSMKDCA